MLASALSDWIPGLVALALLVALSTSRWQSRQREASAARKEAVPRLHAALEPIWARIVAIDRNFNRFDGEDVRIDHDGMRFRVQYLGDRSVTSEHWYETADALIESVVERAVRGRARHVASLRREPGTTPEQREAQHFEQLMTAAFPERAPEDA